MAASGNSVGDGGALALRRQIYGAGDATRADLEMLIAQGRQQGADPDFAELLAEVATDVLVRQVDPEGYITEDDAKWLIARLGEGGGLAVRAEFEMLKTLFGHAVDVPAELTAFAVRELEKAILTGRRDGDGAVDHQPGIVTADDVAALRAFAFAPTHGSSLHVDRETAEALFDIAHATATAPNDPEFADFFAKAIGNYLMGAAFIGTPARADALAHEAERDKPQSFAAFLSAMAHGPSLDNFETALESTEGLEEDAYARENAQEAEMLDKAEAISDDEAKWVIAHLTRGGALTPAEKRLLMFIKDEAPSAPPELTALFDRAA